MAQLFARKADDIFKMILLAIVLLVGLSVALGYAWSYSDFSTREAMPVEQIVPFSHQHHVGGLGIDCRYCHASVEESAYAGMPASSVCMNCHSQIWPESTMLEPVRAAYRQQKPLVWAKVHALPDFVYFDHSIHVAKGVGCETCHGLVDQMPLMSKVHTLHMEWCLDCHRNPQAHVRPLSAVTVMGWQPPKDLVEPVPQVESRMDCVTCHR